MGATNARKQAGRLLSVDGVASVPLRGGGIAHDRWIQAEPGSTDAARNEQYLRGAMGVTNARKQTGCLLRVVGAASVPLRGGGIAHDRWIQA